MIFIKVNKLVSNYGTYDYKGLDLSKVVPGSQVYPFDLESNNYCVMIVRETVVHDDIDVLSEDMYLQLKAKIEKDYPVVEDEQSKIEQLEQENYELKMATAELAEQQVQSNYETNMAIAELAELVIGGVE